MAPEDKSEGEKHPALPGKFAARHIASLDAELQKRMRGPAGGEIREAHVLEQVAQRLFGSNFDKARRLIEVPSTALGDLSMREAAATHEGMLQVKVLIEQLEAVGFADGTLTLASGAHQLRVGEANLLIDLLPAAWGMTDREFEQILQSPEGWMRARRNHEVGLGPSIRARLRRLLRFQNALRLIAHPQGYAEAWRRPWARGSPIEARSPWEAYVEEGDAALDAIEAYLSASACLS